MTFNSLNDRLLIAVKEKRLDFELNQANATMNQNRGLQAEV